MNFKKFQLTKLNIILLAAAFCFALFMIIFAIHTFRTEVNLIVVSDELYENFVEKAPKLSEKTKLTFVKASCLNSYKESFFGKKIRVAAELSSYIETGLEKQKYEVHQKFYELESKSYLPSLPADFKNGNSLIEADLSVSITDAANIPQGSRALPVDNLYADNPEYKLLFKKGVLATVFNRDFEKVIDDYCKKTFVSEELKEKSELITIASVGDIMVARGIQEILIDDEDGLTKVFDDTLPILQGADFSIGNLEGVVTESWKNAIKTYTFKFKKAVLPKLMDAGFDYLMQTNNHCYDYGETGFKDTLAAFKEYEIPSSGIGYNEEEAKKFYHKTIKGLPVAVISCGAFPVEQSGFNGEKTATATETRAGILWKSDELLELVKAEKDAGYFVIVNIHGGEEYRFTPTKSQRQYYEDLCDSGADVVFGSHPHVLQPTEWHGNSLIVFSMGNFLFNGMEGMRGGTDSEIVKLGILDGRIAYVEQYPVAIKKNGVTLKK
ncbi:CapA family protein [Treponema sp.]|uniref:CapA family protein n=1 Tax=Treponema sp. TaxID=166 RepID=UPI0025D17E26|nr:CapA family protein [Treponema sp.]MCR5218449.1 CapA family protein [Treponema sp.]